MLTSMHLPITLPDRAQKKLSDLIFQMQRDQDITAGATARLHALQRSSPGREPGDRAAVDHEMSKLNAVIDQHQHRANEASILLSRIEQWRTRTLKPDDELEMADEVRPEQHDDENEAEGIMRVRDQIAATRMHLDTVRTAPLPVSDQKQLAADLVHRLCNAGRPKISVEAGKLKTAFDVATIGADGILAMIAWAAPDALTKSLKAEIDAMPAAHDAMSEKEKRKRIDELTAQLDQLERQEESLIEAAHAQGLIDLLRRNDASPACVLNVRIKTHQVVRAA